MSLRLVMEWQERDGMPRLRIAVARGGTVLHADELRSLDDVERLGASLQRELRELLTHARWRFLDFEARRAAAASDGPRRVRLVRG
jgi:hypothetical protein